MKFRNTRTGVVLDNMPENFGGKYWEPVDTPAPATVKKKATPKKTTKKTAKK